jgi:hypothetical protein
MSPCAVCSRLRAGLLVALLAGLLAGCGTSQTSLVRAKVQQFAIAVHDHRYATICRQVLAPQLLVDIAAGGVACPVAMRIGLGRVTGARLVIGQITVSGARARVLTLTQAKAEASAITTLVLTRTRAGWRIASLGTVAG